MRGNKKVIESKSRQHTTIHLSPIAQAVRTALAVSAIALAGTGPVFAGGCHDAPQTKVVRCTVAESANAPIVDLTSVADRQVPTAVMTAHAFESDASDISGTDASGIAKANASAFSVDIVNNGTIDQSGSGDVVGIDAEFGGADITIVNGGSGDIQAASTAGLADGVFAYGADITVNNRGTIEADGYTWAAGVETQGDSVTINNNGDISATATAYATADPDAGTEGIYGHAYGVYAVGYSSDGVVVNNRGTISATGPYATGVYAYDGGGGGIGINNRGDITATADNGYAAGIKTVSNLGASDTDVSNRGSITATGMNGASGIAVNATGLGSSASVDNRGDIYAASTEYYSIAEGIAVSTDGDASIRNRGSITIGYGDYAYGGLALAFAGDADIDNAGDVSVNGGLQAYGFVAASQNGQTSVRNDGAITTDSGFGNGIGIGASSLTGTEVRNDGVIDATGNSNAVGVLGNSSQGDTVVDNRGSITTDGKYSFGVLAQSVDGDALVDNRGDITGAGKYAYGVVAGSTYGDAVISNAEDGTITGYSSQLLAVGTFANAGAGSATIDNRGTINAQGTTGAQLAYGAVVQTASGDGLVDNRGSIDASNSYGAARGVIVRSSGGGGASVVNRGDIGAVSTGSGVYEGYYGTYAVNTDVIGVYAYAPGGEAVVDNRGSITASTQAGLADGVFAAGAVTQVDNSGSITANGYTWGAGIEAQGDNAATVNNRGDIAASATAYAPADPEAGTEAVYGHAYGIYATGGDGGVTVDNQGTIAATGPYATGIYAYDGGSGGTQIGNSGDITAGEAYASIYGTGILASSVYADADISVDNSGSIAANSYYGSTGIDVLATGVGSTGSVVNNGDIQVNTVSRYGAATGVAVSADGDAVVDNAGNISVSNASASAYNYYVGTRIYGVQALSFAGDAEVVNSGSIAVDAGIYSYAGYGMVAATTNGTATVDNLGSIDVADGYLYAAGILAQGQAGATVSNSGTIRVASDVARYGAFGVQATSSQGDASVDNSGLISVTSGEVPTTGAFASGATANVSNSGQIDIAATFLGYGAVALSQDGDASVTNDGAIAITTASGAAVGANVQAEAGATVTNTGSITLTALTDTFGIIASAASGGAFVDNSGTITAFSDTPFNGNSNGIAVAAMGDALVDNSGAISATGGKYATGISASSVTDDIQAFNSGSIAVGDAKYATGIEATAQAGDVLVDNAASGTVSASASNGFAFGVAGVSQAGDVQVDNAGMVAVADDLATAPYPYAVDVIGIYAAGAGDVSVDNSGAISALSTYGLADGVFAAGAVTQVDNSGSITANGYTWGAGIEAQGSDTTSVTSTGDITASATAYAPADPEAGTEAVYGHAYGIYVAGGDGGVSVDNRGTIAASGAYANGIYAYDYGVGGIAISNRGDIGATAANGIANGISALTNVEYSADIDIGNRGNIEANGLNAAAGITAVASGAGSAISASNNGAISAIAMDAKYGNASGMVASAEGDAEVRNGRNGSIYASSAYAYGAMSLAFAGDSTVVNAGDITAYARGILYAGAYGVVSSSQNGTAEVTNTGSISVTTNAVAPIARGIDASGVDVDVVNRGSIDVFSGKYGRGISAVASTGDVAVDNRGSIYVGGAHTDNSYGVAGISTDGDVRITNAADGLVSVYYAASTAVGLLGTSTNDDVEIVNAGDIVIRDTPDEGGTNLAAGVYASSGNNDVSVINRGTIDADARFTSIGILSNIGDDDELSVDNRGTIHADSRSAVGIAEGIEGSSQNGGDVMLRNRGTIVSSSTASDEFTSASAFGMAGIVAGGGELTLANTRTGSITVTAINGDATGLYGRLTDADVTVDNAGSITVSSTNGTATAIRIESGAPLTTDATVADNGNHLVALSGTGLAAATAGSAKAAGRAGTATIRNSGSLVATSETGRSFAVYGSDGTERIINRGTIQGAIVTNGGNDSLDNLRNGTWRLTGTGTDFGAGNDSFNNARGATLELADAGIDFGAGDNHFQNMGMVKVSGTNHIDMTGGQAGAASFTNDGVIDFVDGAADDSLTVTGGFGGRGAVDLDVNLGSKLSDHLFVQGGIAKGTHQVVNVALLGGLPKSSDVGTKLQLVHVSGDTRPSAFVAGRVLGVSPRDFLSMGLTLSAKPDSSTLSTKDSGGGSSYMLSVKTFVSGLNAAGVLASSTAMAVDSLMSSTIGSHGDRTYMTYTTALGNKQPAPGFTPWVRRFSDKSGMTPDHMAANFGQLANSHFSQDNYGNQMGLEYRVGNGFRFGTMFAKSEGRQHLVNDSGMNTIRAHTMGMYGSWVSPRGLYFDASWRSMQFQADIDSIGGRQRGEGHAVGTMLEFGRTLKLGNGLTVVPRLRYTETTVDGLNIQGYQATFESQDTHWKRASAGVSLQKSFTGASGWQWTPYGEASVVQTLDGVTDYAINQDYFGQVMTKGTSAVMKFGIGAQKGQLSWNGGVNWIDGGNVDGAYGAQMSLRYSW